MLLPFGMRIPVVLSPIVLLLAGCGTTPVPSPIPARADTIAVYVMNAADTTPAARDSAARALNAAAIRWVAADTPSAAALIARGALPLVTDLPVSQWQSVRADSVTTTPLPATRIYALLSDSVSPVDALSDSAGRATVASDLARFAVTANAEPATGGGPATVACDGSTLRAAARRPRIVYLESDSIARQVAERLAALSMLTAEGLAPREFGWSLSDGRDAGVVVAVPLAPGATAPRSWCGAMLMPLIRVRPTLVTRAVP